MILLAAFENMDVVKILGYGVLGLGFLLAVLAFWLLQREQTKDNPNEQILKSVKTFMVFSSVLCVFGIGSQFLDQSRATRRDEEIKTINDKNTRLVTEVAKHKEQDGKLRIQLKEIDRALTEKEYSELNSLISVSDPAIRERLKRTIVGLKDRLSEAKKLLEVE